MTPNARKGYTVRIARLPEDRVDILRLWEAALPALAGEAGEAKLRSMYTENPAGRGVLFLLHDPEGEVVGVMGLGSRTYRFGDRTLRAGIMADLTVAPDHRALGPALLLLRAAVTGSSDDFDFLCGFPNERSEPVLVRAAYKKLGEMTRYGRPLRSAQYLERRFAWGRVFSPLLDVVLWVRDLGRRALSGRTLEYREAEDFDTFFDEFWATCSKPALLMADRPRPTLTWYFSELVAGQEWRVSTARVPGSGELRGYVVWRVAEGVAQVADFLWLDAAVGQTLLERLAWSARSRGCASISVEFSGSPDVVKTLRDARFHQREARPIYYVPGDLAEEGAFDEWYLTGFDRDAL